jgi:acyl-CoA reductase-like NAD-dependent aldehyde dehydrogenase
MDTYGIFINGEEVPAASGKTFQSINPATGEPFAEVAEGDAEDIDRAARAAQSAYPAWRQKSASSRGKLLYRLAQLVDQHRDDLARLQSQDMGKPLRESLKVDATSGVDALEYFAGIANKVEGRTIPVPGRFLNYTLREPWGVVGQIIPWNFPLLQAVWKIAPAVAAGNTVVLKPAEQAPLVPVAVARLAAEAGFPPGVINVVPGYGETAGAALCRHPLVRRIAFTGSTETGRIVARMAGDGLKPVTLELGGKSPVLIFEDADPDQAASIAFLAIFTNQGEVCTAGSRVLVRGDMEDAFVSAIAGQMTRKMVVGDPLSEQTTLGPLVSEEQLERVRGYVTAGIDEGARVGVKGEKPSDANLQGGYFVEPVVFTDVSSNMKIAQEEIFGPVLTVVPFSDEEEAIRLANDTEYGLAATILTRDVERAHRVAAAVEAGNIWVNTWGNVHSASPYGGYKMSGYGREMGFEVMEEYTQVKSVWISLGKSPSGERRKIAPE